MSAVETEEALCAEYAAWCEAQRLPATSAEELLHETITEDQRRYLSAFMVRWERMLEKCVMKLFVYGTLKRGYGLNRYLETSQFLGEAVTFANCFSMTTVGFPIVSFGGTHRVAGEVYEVTDPDVQKALDHIEGGYDRRIVPAILNGETVDVHIYIGKHAGRGRPVDPNADGVLVFGREHQGGW